MKNQFIITGLVAICCLLSCTNRETENISNVSNDSVLVNNYLSYKISIPQNWHIEKSYNDSSYLQLVGNYVDTSITMELYAGKLENNVSMEKLIDSANKFLPFLGKEIERKKITGNKYQINYQSAKEYSLGIFIAKDNTYQMLFFYAINNDFSKATPIIQSFKSDIHYSWYTILFLIGTISLAIHLALLHYAFFSWLRENIFWALLSLAGLIILDYLVVYKLFQGYSEGGFDGLIFSAINCGPEIFEEAGEFISETIADAIGIGFWPGGKIGVILTTILSLVGNFFEMAAMGSIFNRET